MTSKLYHNNGVLLIVAHKVECHVITGLHQFMIIGNIL